MNVSAEKLTITDSAAARIRVLADQDGNPKLRLRITIEGGGCSGFQYNMDLDGSESDGDAIFRHDKAEVIVDDLTLGLLTGAVLDYVETLTSANFEIKNPNAAASCGCGNSFSV